MFLLLFFSCEPYFAFLFPTFSHKLMQFACLHFQNRSSPKNLQLHGKHLKPKRALTLKAAHSPLKGSAPCRRPRLDAHIPMREHAQSEHASPSSSELKEHMSGAGRPCPLGPVGLRPLPVPERSRPDRADGWTPAAGEGAG